VRVCRVKCSSFFLVSQVRTEVLQEARDMIEKAAKNAAAAAAEATSPKPAQPPPAVPPSPEMPTPAPAPAAPPSKPNPFKKKSGKMNLMSAVQTVVAVQRKKRAGLLVKPEKGAKVNGD